MPPRDDRRIPPVLAHDLLEPNPSRLLFVLWVAMCACVPAAMWFAELAWRPLLVIAAAGAVLLGACAGERHTWRRIRRQRRDAGITTYTEAVALEQAALASDLLTVTTALTAVVLAGVVFAHVLLG